jgi:SP family myo-inositol transporter-like MFS transporter 13
MSMSFDPNSPADEKKDHGSLDELEMVANTLASGEISELAIVAEGEERTTWFVWLLVLCSSISGLLFGSSWCFSSYTYP